MNSDFHDHLLTSEFHFCIYTCLLWSCGDENWHPHSYSTKGMAWSRKGNGNWSAEFFLNLSQCLSTPLFIDLCPLWRWNWMPFFFALGEVIFKWLGGSNFLLFKGGFYIHFNRAIDQRNKGASWNFFFPLTWHILSDSWMIQVKHLCSILNSVFSCWNDTCPPQDRKSRLQLKDHWKK